MAVIADSVELREALDALTSVAMESGLLYRECARVLPEVRDLWIALSWLHAALEAAMFDISRERITTTASGVPNCGELRDGIMVQTGEALSCLWMLVAYLPPATRRLPRTLPDERVYNSLEEGGSCDGYGASHPDGRG